MSFSNFFNEPQMNSQCPNLNYTLLFIETNKYIPASESVTAGKKIPEQQQNYMDSQMSIDLNLPQANPEMIISSTPLIKKRKNGCICKKTKCLKMYCECFSSGKLCTFDCSCCDCSNNDDHPNQIAQAQELIKTKSMSSKKQGQGKGCNCKKTQCLKKYCECFNSRIACSSECKCQGCANGEEKKLQLSLQKQQKKDNEIAQISPCQE